MSDMPMRLKYLTKMKIVLCIFLLYITVSVFGQSQELNGIEGERIEFPAAVETGRSLMYGSKVIGRVLSGALMPLTDPEYQGRVQWDKSTGLFSLSGLRLKDSGVYTVQNSDEPRSVSTFSLTVWKDNVPVLKPHVSITHNEYPCTIECTAERGTGVTLSWYREGEEKPYVSSRVASAPYLHLPETVERSGTYTCEAKNSVSNEKASITVGAHCTAVFGGPQELNGIVGKSIEFPAAVETGGNLMYGSKVIGRVLSGALLPLTTRKYQGRVQWDSSTGLFSLSELKEEDSGEYTVQDTHPNINTVFQLNVYIPVSKPNVIFHNESCTIECTAERGTGVTLSWYREGQTKPYVSSRVASAPHLHLPETVERSGTYTCEAKNSVSNEKASITVEAHCSAPTDLSTGEIVLFVFVAGSAPVVIAVVVCGLLHPPVGSSTLAIVLVTFLIIALIAALIYFLCCSPVGSSTLAIVLVTFLIIALIAVLIYLLYCWLRGPAKGSDKDDSLPPRSYIINQSDEPEDETPQTRSLTINPQL